MQYHRVQQNVSTRVVLQNGLTSLDELLSTDFGTRGIAHWGDVPKIEIHQQQPTTNKQQPTNNNQQTTTNNNIPQFAGHRWMLLIKLLHVLRCHMEFVLLFALQDMHLPSQLGWRVDLSRSFDDVPPGAEAVVRLHETMRHPLSLGAQHAGIRDILQSSHATTSDGSILDASLKCFTRKI